LRQRIKSIKGNVTPSEMVKFELVDEFTFTLQDKNTSETASGHENVGRDERTVSRLIGKAIIFVYLFLLAMGFRLISNGSFLGYWIVLVLAASIFVSLWNSATSSGEGFFVRLFRIQHADKSEDDTHSWLKFLP
jgi:hypothetical protein